MSEPSEREDLDSLIKSPGWLRYRAYVRKEWGAEGYGVKLKLAIAQARQEGKDVAEAVVRVDGANEEVNKMLSWPSERLRQLEALDAQEQAAKEPHFSRRGGL